MRKILGAAAVTLPPTLLARLNRLVHSARIAGGNYSAQSQCEVDTGQFAAG